MKFTPHQTVTRMAAIALVGLVVGLISAFATIGFVELVNYFNDILYVSASSRAGVDGGRLALITITVLTGGGLIAGLTLRYGVAGVEHIGPADTIYAVQLHERLPSPVSGVSSTVASIISLGCGASVGQYGPLVYLGTLVGQIANRLPFRLSDARSIAIACGVAAAISTAFNAPLAALIFTHEVILRHYSLRMFTAVTVASACGYLVANVVFEHPPLFLSEVTGSFRWVEFLLFALEGIACGMLAVAFMKLLHYTARFANRIKLPMATKPMIAGFITSLVALQVPEILGAGQEVFSQAKLEGSFSADALLLILLAKLLVTVLCIGFGFAGGVIFPALLIGVLFGALFALLVPGQLLSDYSGLSVYAVCGMVALMSPVIGAPMTALLMVFELTQRGIDLSMGRERAYLMHQTVAEHVTDALPVVHRDIRLSELRERMAAKQTESAVIVDADHRYLGLVLQHQLHDQHDSASVASIEIEQGIQFSETTSIWDAMETMREYIGVAVPVIDSVSGRYLGAIPEAVVINAYLDAAQELRREEYEV
jgi:CIC family chloride channel protein